jgi:hypothetical protein
VGYRDTPEGQRQAKALRDAERDSGRKRSEIVAVLPMEHDQYKRYLRGDTPLRWDQIPLFAEAYGIKAADLSRALGLMDDAPTAQDIVVPPGWTLREALRGRLPDDEIKRQAEYWDRFPLANQYAAYPDILRVAREEVEARTLKPRRDQTA